MKSNLLSLMLLFNLCLAGYAQAGDGPKFSWDKVPVYAHFGATHGVTDVDNDKSLCGLTNNVEEILVLMTW